MLGGWTRKASGRSRTWVRGAGGGGPKVLAAAPCALGATDFARADIGAGCSNSPSCLLSAGRVRFAMGRLRVGSPAPQGPGRKLYAMSMQNRFAAKPEDYSVICLQRHLVPEEAMRAPAPIAAPGCAGSRR